MLEKDINDLLQDYKHRKNILEEITLSDIEKWNNIDVDVSWSDVLNKPTDLEGYGLKTEIKENTLNKFSAVNGDFLVNLGFNIKYGDYSIFGIQTDFTTGAPTPKFGMVYNNKKYSYVSTALGNLNLIASDSVYLHTPHFNLKTPWFYVSTEYGTFDVDLKNANAEIFTNVPFRTEKPIKVPKLDILNSSSTREGMLYNSTYKVNDVVHDGIHLRHEDGKYLVLGHLDSTAGENGAVYSYMICDKDGVLRNPSDGDEWGPVRFEQNVFFRHGLRISNNEPLIINNYNLATKIASIESAIETGTGMVQWSNVLNKPSTFTPSSHTHDYLPLSGGTMNGSLTFANGKGIYGKDTNGVAQGLAVVGNDNCCYLGGVGLHTYIKSKDNPQYLDPNGNKYGLFHEGNFPWKIKSRGVVAMETNDSAKGRGLNMAEIYYYGNGYPVAYGNVLELGGNGANQLAFEWKDGLAGGIYHRCLRDISNSWTDWRRLAYADELNNCLPKIVQVSDMHDGDFVQNAYHEFLPTTNIINSFVNVNNHWKVTTAGTYMVNGRIGIYAQNSGFVEIMAQVRDSSDTIAKLTKVLLRVYMNADQTIILSLGEYYFDLATNDILFFLINNNCTINGSTHNTNISVTRIK